MPRCCHFVEASAAVRTRDAVVQLRGGRGRWRQLACRTSGCEMFLRLTCGLHRLPERFGLLPPAVGRRGFGGGFGGGVTPPRSSLGLRALGSTVSGGVELAALLLEDFDANPGVAFKSLDSEEPAAMRARRTFHWAIVATFAFEVGVEVTSAMGCIARVTGNSSV